MEKNPENCWEYKKCDRGPDAKNSAVICSAATETSLDAIHRGDNGGRACWIIAGTYCNGEIQGDYAKKIDDCKNCDFFKKVMEEEELSSENPNDLVEAIRIVARN
jgi:hypothetical protein